MLMLIGELSDIYI